MNDPSPDPTRRLVAEITALIDGHLQRHGQPAPNATVRRSRHPRVHQAPQPVTVFTGDVRIGTVVTGNTTGDPHWSPVHRALQTVRTRLGELDLSEVDEHALRERIDTALDETARVQPCRRRLRRLIGGICTALVTGIASGAADPVANELVAELQRASF